MKTDELIERLGRGGEVTAPLPRPAVRTAAWVAWAAIYTLAATAMIVKGTVPAGVVATPLYLVQQAAALFTGLAAAFAALTSVIPGARQRARILPILGGSVWIASLLWGTMLEVQASGATNLTSHTDWPCVVAMGIGAALLGIPLLWMLRRGAALTPTTTALLGGVAALALANIEACLTRPHPYAMTVLLWHGGTLAAGAALFAWSGRHWLRWPPVQGRLGGVTTTP